MQSIEIAGQLNDMALASKDDLEERLHGRQALQDFLASVTMEDV